MHSLILTGTLLSVIILITIIEQASLNAPKRTKNRKRWPANLTLLMINTGIGLALPLSTVGTAFIAHTHGYGLMNWLNIPFWAASVISFLIISLMMYTIHFAMHKIPLLWRIHQVHHSDDILDITTAFRVHPFSIFVVAIVLNSVAFLIGFVGEVILLYTCLAYILNLLHHTSLMWPNWLERPMRKIIITPELHHIHHSNYQPETDSNFSMDLCIWDKLFNTFLDTPIREGSEITYGLKKVSSDKAEDLQYLLSSPFKP